MARRRNKTSAPQTRKVAELNLNMNENIKSAQVRVLDEDKSQLGVLSLDEALNLASEKDVDLIEIVPQANPPVCQLISNKKYLYQLKKKEKEKYKKQKESQIHIKSMRFGVNTEDHDYNFKLDRIKSFLENNNKVQIFIIFKGRQMMFKNRGYKLMESIIKDLSEVSELEAQPKMAGNRLIMVLAPKKENKQ